MTRRAMPQHENDKPASPTAALPAPCAARQAARPVTTSSAAMTLALGQVAPARSPSQAGLTMRLTAPSRAITAAAGPIDLKPVSTMTGFGVSMKCAPSWIATRRSSLRSPKPAQMARSRSLKVMRPYISTLGACNRGAARPAAEPRRGVSPLWAPRGWYFVEFWAHCCATQPREILQFEPENARCRWPPNWQHPNYRHHDNRRNIWRERVQIGWPL